MLCKRHALLLLATSILNACAKYAAEETVTGTKQETHSINAERSPQFICLPEDSIIVRELQVENRHKRAEPMEPISRFACFEKTLQLIADLEYIAANTPATPLFRPIIQPQEPSPRDQQSQNTTGNIAHNNYGDMSYYENVTNEQTYNSYAGDTYPSYESYDDSPSTLPDNHQPPEEIRFPGRTFVPIVVRNPETPERGDAAREARKIALKSDILKAEAEMRRANKVIEDANDQIQDANSIIRAADGAIAQAENILNSLERVETRRGKGGERIEAKRRQAERNIALANKNKGLAEQTISTAEQNIQTAQNRLRQAEQTKQEALQRLAALSD